MMGIGKKINTNDLFIGDMFCILCLKCTGKSFFDYTVNYSFGEIKDGVRLFYNLDNKQCIDIASGKQYKKYRKSGRFNEDDIVIKKRHLLSEIDSNISDKISQKTAFDLAVGMLGLDLDKKSKPKLNKVFIKKI